MAEKRIIQANHISIALSRHNRKDLIELHKELIPQPKSKKVDFKTYSKMQLVMELSKNELIRKVEDAWDHKLFAANQSVSFHQFFTKDTDEPIQNGIAKIKRKIENFDALLERNTARTLSETPKLFKINKKGNRYFFLFGELGKQKYVPVDFKYEVYQEPRFSYCVWDNDDGYLQVRSASHTGYFTNFFREMLTNSPAPDVSNFQVTEENFDDFVRAINGTVRSAKGKSLNIENDLELKEIRSRKDLDIREADGYEDEMNGFDVFSHGIDFEFETDDATYDHTVYVGFKSGTIYFKKGPGSEDLLDYIKTAISGL